MMMVVMMTMTMTMTMMMMSDALASNDPKSGDYGVPPPDLSWRLGFVVFWWLCVSLLRSDFIG
jgi:hypothetical protein